jgi:hypothetical protein
MHDFHETLDPDCIASIAASIRRRTDHNRAFRYFACTRKHSPRDDKITQRLPMFFKPQR